MHSGRSGRQKRLHVQADCAHLIGMARAPGCLALFLLGLLLLLPLLFANLVLGALGKLGLSPFSSLVIAGGMFLGGAINIPVKRIPRDQLVEVPIVNLYGVPRIAPGMVRRRSYSLLAVNLGGCVVPAGLGLYELVRLANQGFLLAAVMGVLISTAICYHLARPVDGVGITMPALIPALVAALCGLVLAPEMAAPVAFVSGVFGTIIGADLLHLKDVERIAVGMASIGGAGTFDGIVVSGLIATVLA